MKCGICGFDFGICAEDLYADPTCPHCTVNRGQTMITVKQRINELRDHLAFLKRNGFRGQYQVEEKITELVGNYNVGGQGGVIDERSD